MKTKIKKWGNSLAVRIPKSTVDFLGLQENSPVMFDYDKNQIVIKPDRQTVFSIKEMTDKITEKNKHKETEWGGLVGQEVW